MMAITPHEIEQMVPRAVATARNFAKGLPGCFDAEDLECAALEGLVVSAKRYNPQRGAKFSTYAYWFIRGYVKRAIGAQAASIFRGAATGKQLRDQPRDFIPAEPIPFALISREIRAEHIQTPDQWLSDYAWADSVWARLDLLAVRQAQCLALRYGCGYSVEEVGEALGISYTAASASLAYARGVLARRWSRSLEDSTNG